MPGRYRAGARVALAIAASQSLGWLSQLAKALAGTLGDAAVRRLELARFLARKMHPERCIWLFYGAQGVHRQQRALREFEAPFLGAELTCDAARPGLVLPPKVG